MPAPEPSVRVTTWASSLGYLSTRTVSGMRSSAPVWMREAAAGMRLLHRAGGEARNVIVQEEDVEDDDRHRAQHRPGHQRAPEIDVAPDQLAGHPHARGDLLRRGGE